MWVRRTTLLLGLVGSRLPLSKTMVCKRGVTPFFSDFWLCVLLLMYSCPLLACWITRRSCLFYFWTVCNRQIRPTSICQLKLAPRNSGNISGLSGHINDSFFFCVLRNDVFVWCVPVTVLSSGEFLCWIYAIDSSVWRPQTVVIWSRRCINKVKFNWRHRCCSMDRKVFSKFQSGSVENTFVPRGKM